MENLRVIIADDERPARMFLKSALGAFDDVEIIGEAETGVEAVELINALNPDLALLDLQMPELSGLDAVKFLDREKMPAVAFVTAYEEFAVRAFEVNAVDYLLKPVDVERLRETLRRVREKLRRPDFRADETARIDSAVKNYEAATAPETIERVPVRRGEEFFLVPVGEIASVVADGELLHLTTVADARYTINYRLKDFETRVAPGNFIRLSRSALVNPEMILKISPMPGGTYVVTLKNNRRLPVSRMQSKILREKLLRM